MTKSKRLQPVVRVSETRERNAARLLAQATQRLQEAEERLKELQHYRDEYEQNFQRDSHVGVGAAKLRDYRSFMAQLHQAIDFQQRKLSEATAACEAARQTWLASRTRCRVLDKVVDNHRRAERKDEERREQRDQDERAYYAKNGSNVNEDDGK